MGVVIDFLKEKTDREYKRDIERLCYEDEVFTEEEILCIVYQQLEREGFITD